MVFRVGIFIVFTRIDRKEAVTLLTLPAWACRKRSRRRGWVLEPTRAFGSIALERITTLIVFLVNDRDVM